MVLEEKAKKQARFHRWTDGRVQKRGIARTKAILRFDVTANYDAKKDNRASHFRLIPGHWMDDRTILGHGRNVVSGIIE